MGRLSAHTPPNWRPCIVNRRLSQLRFCHAALVSLAVFSCAPSFVTASAARSDNPALPADRSQATTESSPTTDRIAAPFFDSPVMQPIDSSVAFRVVSHGVRLRASDIGGAKCVALGDFDEDGVQDIVVQLSVAGRAALGLYRGNGGAIYPNHPIYRAAGDAPFKPVVDLMEFGVSFEFLVSGDFDADGHLDVAGAESGEKQIHVVFGNGSGRFDRSSSIALTGRVHGLASGEFGRIDGLADLGVAIEGEHGPAIVVLTGPEGAVAASPLVTAIPASTEAIAFGHADAGSSSDLVVGVDDQLVVIRREREGVSSQSLQVDGHVQSIVIGAFGPSGRIAVLTEHGAVQIVAPSDSPSAWRGKAPATRHTSAIVVTGNSGRLLRAGVLADGTDALVVVGSESNLLTSIRNRSVTELGRWIGGAGTSAAVAFRLSPDAPAGIVAFDRDSPVPVALAPKVTSTILVTNTDDAGAGSLREAILQANSTLGLDRIEFDIPGSGPHTIRPLTPLHVVSESVTIDGQSEPDFDGSPVVVLDGTDVVGIPGLIERGIDTEASECVIRGLNVGNFAGPAIEVGSGANTIVEGNWLGLDPTGNLPAENIYSVRVFAGPGHVLGGTSEAARNIVSAASAYGVVFAGQSCRIEGNFFGLNASGTGAVPNSFGIRCSGSNNVIGGLAPGARNVVSGNLEAGLIVLAAGTLIQGNLVGTDATGSFAIPNGQHGIDTQSGTGMTVGGTSPAARNVISGNAGHGVTVSS